jgi:RHS repeat-associated protein
MSSHKPSLLCRYGYDPLDRLTDQSKPNTTPVLRFYCKRRLATEIQGALECSIFQHDDLLLAQQRRESDVSVNALLATDQQRSLLQSVDKNSPSQPIAYSPYGHRHGESGLTSLLGFNGELPDPVTGHYLLGNGYRAFNPVLMRFNSPDSMSPFGRGGLNAYTYCLGDPVNRNDPTGNVSAAILAKMNIFKKNVQLEAVARVTPGGGMSLSDELLQVARSKLVTFAAGRRGPQVLRVKEGRYAQSITPDQAIKFRDEMIELEFTNKRNNKNNVYFEQMDAAINTGDLPRVAFLESISSAKPYKAFDRKKMWAGVDRDALFDPATIKPNSRTAYVRDLHNALEANYDKNISKSVEQAQKIRATYFK